MQTNIQIYVYIHTQPGTVRAMRSAAEAIAQLAHADTKELKIKFMQSGLIHVLAALSRSLVCVAVCCSVLQCVAVCCSLA